MGKRVLCVGVVALALCAGGVFAGDTAGKPKHIVYEKWPFDAKEAKRRQKETAEALGLPVLKSVDLGAGVKLELALIPAGEFMMGGEESPAQVAKKCRSGIEAEAEWFKNEHPQHRVRITKPFYMGKYEVTQEQWEKVMGENPSKFKWAKNPVEQVSWDDCQKFIGTVNGLGKWTLRLPAEPEWEYGGRGKGMFRLPTEAEWEYACRAGTSTAFHTGETISSDHANYNGNLTYGDGKKGEYRGKTTAVGTFAANAFGLYDMHGNMDEWCGDWYGAKYYSDSPKEDPTGPATGSGRVVRGGCWGGTPSSLRSAFRYFGSPPDVRHHGIGVRAVLSCAER